MSTGVEVPPRVLAALEPMPEGYVGLLRSAVGLLAARPEVRAVCFVPPRPAVR